ncbi:MAG: beta-lactamase family protein [Marinifilaceae bacterium]|jgi:CubicO group peptidase (beta-lactamase class C family)|nr:beta-lactamase family protein [Marinifilaceae bacterium]
MKFRITLGIILLFSLILFARNTIYSTKGSEKPTTDLALNSVSNRLYNNMSDYPEYNHIDKLVSRFMNRWEICGLSLSISKNKKLVFSKGYGYSDAENKTEMQAFNIFRIASVSKLITAVAIMKLYEDGYLKLEDKVFGKFGILNQTEFQNIKDKRTYNITVEHLLRHSSGYSNRYGDPMFIPTIISRKLNQELPINSDDIIRYMLSKKLHFSPGTSSSYSNLGYVILEKVIEKITNTDYETYVQNYILHPCGIFDMHLGKNKRINKLKNEVNYYEQDNAIKVSACNGTNRIVSKSNGGNDIESLGGAGGWVASTPELIKFALAIDGDDTFKDILSGKSIEYMTNKSKFSSYPIGWSGNVNNLRWRSGSLAGTSALLKYNDQMCFSIVTNESTWRGSDFTNDLNRLLKQIQRTTRNWVDINLFYPEDQTPI